MNIAPRNDAFHHEFLIRYRMPRPVSRSFEAVALALNDGDMRQRCRWCARVAVRFLGALWQLAALAGDAGEVPGPPSHYDFRRPLAAPPFPPELASGIPAELLQLAGVYRGAEPEDIRSFLFGALRKIDYLAACRIVVVTEKGFNVLFGPRIEYPVHSVHEASFLGRFPPGTPLLADPSNGRYLSLQPLVIWSKSRSSPFGSLFVLRHLEGLRGQFVEEGLPGFPIVNASLSGSPARGVLPVEPGVLDRLRSPPVRFCDGASEDPYDILGLIWRGGLSDVYVARRKEDDGRVVVKTYEGERGLLDESYRYFRDEESLGNRVRHRGVVSPVKVPLAGGGVVYEQELIDKGSLNDLIQSNGVLTAETARCITEQLLDALEAVHGVSVVHNDVKPDNILFKDDGTIRLIDFGIAKSLERENRNFRSGTVTGTRGYMAPELVLGHPPTVRSDLYSVGVVLAQMLCGRVISSFREAAASREIPRAFLPFLEGCLAADERDRYPSAREALPAIRGIPAESLRTITLDVEGTLVDNGYEQTPRPGLGGFLEFLLKHFHRIFVYTTLTAEETEDVFRHLFSEGHVPRRFLERYEYIPWGRRSEDFFKDLRRCRVPLESNRILDDSEAVIPEDQVHWWIPIEEFYDRNAFDRGLFIAADRILEAFRLKKG
ncbi:MAG TPA: NIF family HAD-type phosphatase [Syntrophales bacterium]|nr:NIF family HAD-type phosphatase [Syntrophales bacterium]HQN78029.1 NIF family HAD-type phosphatase [Syntrophales bacterium]HQQ26972.1 NIF family HAD-type phosphatase [Syntrophales bacterium]